MTKRMKCARKQIRWKVNRHYCTCYRNERELQQQCPGGLIGLGRIHEARRVPNP
jgi:hypothetical protein